MGPEGPQGAPGEPLSGGNWVELNQESTPALTNNFSSALSVSATFPEAGYAYVSASWYFRYTGAETAAQCYVSQTSPQESGPLRFSRSNTIAEHRDNASLTRVFEVEAGSETFHLACRRWFGTGTVRVSFPEMNVLFVPRRYE